MRSRLQGALVSGLVLFSAPMVLAQPTPVPPSGKAEKLDKSGLRVLLVGHDPQRPFINYDPTPAMRALLRERTPAFAKLLRAHFRAVEVVYAADYRVAMSDAVDVTLFDARPPVLAREAKSGRPAWQHRRLPQDFGRPALMVAEVAADIGGPIGLKLDWL